MECSVSVCNNWNAVFGSKLGGISISRELCKWIGSPHSYFLSLRVGCWFGSSSEGTSLICERIFPFTRATFWVMVPVNSFPKCIMS